MFDQKVISILMTVIVFACPFCNCGDCSEMTFIETAESIVVQSHCCSHCSSDSEQQENENEDTKKSQQLPCDCEGENCFCNGAVLPFVTRCPDQNLRNELAAYSIANFDVQSGLEIERIGQISLSSGSQPHQRLSGWELCIFVNSQQV